jgi:acetyltransferase
MRFDPLTPGDLRPIRCGDQGLLQQFVRDLSPRSRQRRFLFSLHELSPQMVRRLSCVDGVRHVAFVVEDGGSAARRFIAEGRLAPADDNSSAELAFAVADGWQRQGIGSRLVAALLAAAERRGVRTVFGDLLRDNEPAARLLRKFGFALAPHPDDALLLRAVHAYARYDMH